MEFNDKLIERIRNGINVNFDNSMFSIDADGNILFDDKGFTSLYTKMPRYYDFLCESFMLLGDAHVKLGEYTEAVEAYSEAVSANNYSEEYKSDDRDLALKLKLAEANAKNSAIDEAKSILSKVEIRLRFLSEASMNELSLMREQKRIEGYIARQIGDISAETSFNEAIKLAHIMLKESPTTENRKYIVELYENLFSTTNSEEVKKDCVEKMIGFANSNLMKQSAPKTMEALGDIFMSIYRCNKDEQYLKKSNQIFKKLVERYPESSVFLAKLYIVKAYLSE
jgi:tetratricopeptide (TPR) repeat protein